MNRFLIQLSLAVLTCTLTLSTTLPAHAILNGATISVSITDGFFSAVQTAMVGPGGPEFGMNTNPLFAEFYTAFVDVSDSSFSIYLQFASEDSGGFPGLVPNQISLFDLIWVNDPTATITGLTLLPGSTLPISSTPFIDNSLSVNINTLTLKPLVELGSSFFAEFEIQTTHSPQPVPESSTMILPGTGLAGIVVWR